LIAPCSYRRANVIIACSAYNPFCEIFTQPTLLPRMIVPHFASFA
jgi:hypothetical protein